MEVPLWRQLVNVFVFLSNIRPEKIFLCGLGGLRSEALLGRVCKVGSRHQTVGHLACSRTAVCVKTAIPGLLI